MRNLKSFIPERYKGPIVAQIQRSRNPRLENLIHRKKAIIGLAGFYQNLGDLALTYAQKRFIEQTLPDYKVVYFSSKDTYRHIKSLKRVVGPKDIITTIGGGNMDDVYSSLENARRYLVKNFPTNPIISFPQTMDFSEGLKGRRALSRSMSTYGKHKRLSIFAREASSFKTMERSFSRNAVFLVPDVVLSLTLDDLGRDRNGIMAILRSDCEALLTEEHRQSVYELISGKTDDFIIRDTVDVTLDECQPATFEETLESFWELISTKKLVVTDRLHGMIFCVITRTPVIVLSNNNHKIKSTYHSWLKDHSYVRFLEEFDLDSISNAMDELMVLTEEEIIAPDLSNLFTPLREALLKVRQ